MANKQIKDLTQKSVPASTDKIALDDGSTNVTYYAQIGNLWNGLGSGTPSASKALLGDGSWGTLPGGFWTVFPGTPVRASNTTFTNTGDYTSVTAYPFGKGLVIKWTESGVVKVGMISIPPTYSAPNQTNTFIGDTMSSIDAGSLKYAMVERTEIILSCIGSIDAVTTNQFGSWTAFEPYRVIGADVEVGTAGTTNSSTFDINIAGTTCFTTKPTLATTVRSSPTPFTADSGTSLALGQQVTADIDAIQTTVAVDAYLHLYLFPTRYLYLT